jgi:hypothetical protein
MLDVGTGLSRRRLDVRVLGDGVRRTRAALLSLGDLRDDEKTASAQTTLVHGVTATGTLLIKG